MTAWGRKASPTLQGCGVSGWGDAPALSVVPFSLRRDGRVWLGSWLRGPVMPRVMRRVPVGLHQHGVSVEIECDAWALVSVDAE